MSAQAVMLRMVSWNIAADVSSGTYNGITYGGALADGTPKFLAQMETVLEGIGTYNAVNAGQSIDVLALQEMNYTGWQTTLSSIVSSLNAHYGAGTYAYVNVFDTTTGNLTGNGPSGLIYNTTTVSVVGTKVVGSVSGSGASRAPMRYTLQPVGFDSSAQYYLYVEHMKSGAYTSGSPTTNGVRRNVEAQTVRADADALGASAHVVYTGDFNLDSGTSEAAWSTLTAAGNGQAIDSGDWTSTRYLTYSSQGERYRDDLFLYNAPMTNTKGVQYVAGSFNVFGNNGSLGTNVPLNNAGNTALSGLSNRTDVLNALVQVTDHSPVVADFQTVGYFAVVPEPGAGVWAVGVAVVVGVRRR
jgi:hypothetical protein